MLIDEIMARFQMEAECWTQLVVEPQQKMKDRWEECLKNWGKINQKMRDIHLPEFGMPDDFTNLNDIVKQFLELDEIFEVDVLEVKMLERGQIKRLIDGPIGASWILYDT
jgi:hypothetical protein